MRPDEPLAESAPLAWRWAARLCRPEPGGCAWYHGAWQCLKLLGIVAGPEVDADFFASAFASTTFDRDRPRVLVCGAADYSMLAHALAAFRALGLEPRFSVLDPCRTPLELNLWYARRSGADCEVVQADMADFAPAARYDVVTTHILFGHVPPQQRARLLAAWREALSPDGRVVTVVKLRPGFAAAQDGFSAEQRAALRETARQRIAGLSASLGVAHDVLGGMLETYMEKRRPFPVRSAAEVEPLFAQAGFRIEAASTTAAAAGPRPADWPGAGGERLRLIARPA